MFCAIYKNGAVIERDSFDILPKSEEVFFYVRSEGDKLRADYTIIDSHGEPTILQLNGCKLIGIALDNYQEYPYLKLEFEIHNLGATKLKLWKSEWHCDEALSSVAIIADRIAKCGYDIYLTLRELEQENRKLKWENKDLKEEHTALLKHLNFLETELSRVEAQQDK